MNRALLAANAALALAAGGPGLAFRRHDLVWVGRPRRRRPVRYILVPESYAKPAKRRARRNVPRQPVLTKGAA